MRFLPWHFSFFWRDRAFLESEWGERSKQYPLMQTRLTQEADLPPLEALLRDPREEVHGSLAAALWDSADDAEAVQRFSQLADEFPPVAGEGQEIRTSYG